MAYVIKAILEGALAIALFKRVEVARWITIMSAILIGMVLGAFHHGIVTSTSPNVWGFGIQVIYSGTLILLLTGNTSPLSMRVGRIVFALFAVMAILSVFGGPRS